MSTPGPRPGHCRAGQWMLQARTTQPSRLRVMIWTLFHLPSLSGDARWPKRQIFSLDGISSPVSPKELEPDILSFGPRKEGGREETEHTHRPMYTHKPICTHQTRAHTCTYVGMYAHLHKRDTCVHNLHTQDTCAHVHSHNLTNMCTCVNMNVHVCVCAGAHVHARKGTHACTHREASSLVKAWP